MSVQENIVIRKSRKGNVIAVSREHYLRDDLSCGSDLCRICKHPALGLATGRLGANQEAYVIPDVSAVLDQTDVILSGIKPFKEVLFLETVINEVRLASAKVYARVKEALTTMGSSANYAIFSNEHHRSTFVKRSDQTSASAYSEECILSAATWLDQHWKPIRRPAILVTDKDLLGKTLETVEIISVENLVRKYEGVEPQLRDLVQTRDENSDVDMRDAKRPRLYPDYIPLADAQRKVKNGKLFQGVFNTNPFNRLEGTVKIQKGTGDEGERFSVLIQGRENMNRSVQGDFVIVETLPKDQWKVPSKVALDEGDDSEDDDGKDSTNVASEAIPTGKVVSVSKRNWRPFGGSLDAARYTGGDSALFIPAEKAIPRIRIRSRRVQELLRKRLQVVIDAWDRNSHLPRGHVVREIGEVGDVDAETEMLLLENDVPTWKFSSAALACLPTEDWKVTEENVHSRLDLRSKCIVSVDPPGCTDIDDALHCEEKPDGTFEVGVHIADVTAFLRHGSELDKEASDRGTTVYLVDRRIEMLPSLLSSKLCSLMGEVERLAFSAIFHMDQEGNELDVYFRRSVIRSARAMTYEEAQNRIDAHRKGKRYDSPDEENIAKSLFGLASIAEKLRLRRTEAGALSLASPEIKFKFQEETHEVVDAQTYEIRETNRMVEEFMLLANIAVAKKLVHQFPQCAMLRRHPKPLPEQFESLLKTAKSFGVELDVSSSKGLNNSLNNAERLFRQDPYAANLLRILTTRCMTQAVYFSSGEVSAPEYVHYGLAAPIYTHFTSPIRRYADVIVHRLLAASLGYASLPEDLQNSKKMQEVAENINHRHKCAQYAARSSIALHTRVLLRDKIIEEDARIVRLLSNALVVLVPKYGVEGIVYLDPQRAPGTVDASSSAEDAYVLDEDKLVLTCKDGRTFKVMGTVRVRVSVDTTGDNREGVVFELISKKK